MAQVNVSQFLRSLDSQLGRAMDRTLEQMFAQGRPGGQLNGREVLKMFINAAELECPGWLNVPDNCVRVTQRP